jgi:hypothetical protein
MAKLGSSYIACQNLDGRNMTQAPNEMTLSNMKMITMGISMWIEKPDMEDVSRREGASTVPVTRPNTFL